MTADIRSLVERYVGELTAAGAIRSPEVERAFRKVERHRLLETFYYRDGTSFTAIDHDPEAPRRENLELIYAANALATRQADGMPTSSTSLPALVAQMLELLELSPGRKVLEIGAGTGYNAALLAEITGDQRLVTTVDVQADVVEQTGRLLAGAGYPRIQVLVRDGFDGVPELAPFDRIVATVGCSDLSPHWVEQLADDGAMLIPLEHAGSHPLALVRKDRGALRGRVVQWTGFMPVRGLLHIADLWPRGVVAADAGELARGSDAGPRFAASRPNGSGYLTDDQADFLFFVGLEDRRASWTMHGPGISAGFGGWAGMAADGIWWWKDVSLACELDRLYQDWDARGRPGISAYRLSFRPAGSEAEAGPPGDCWVIERRFYRELVTLQA